MCAVFVCMFVCGVDVCTLYLFICSLSGLYSFILCVVCVGVIGVTCITHTMTLDDVYFPCTCVVTPSVIHTPNLVFIAWEVFAFFLSVQKN